MFKVKNRGFLIVFSGILLLISFIILNLIYRRFIYSFGFTDEGDNISIGSFLLMGKKLYAEIFSQHQPLTYYFSALILKITDPDNLLLVVRRHRQFVMIFSYLWITFLTYRFGLVLLPFLFILELAKYYFLGHLFLAEGLVIYPLIYLFGLFWETLHGRKLSRIEAVFFSFLIFFSLFNLLPLIITLTILTGFLVFCYFSRKKILFGLIMPFLFGTVLLFSQISIPSYIEGALWANFFYYIPRSQKFAFNIEQPFYQMLINALFYPFSVFFVPGNALIYLYRLLTVAWITAAGLYVYLTKRWKVLLFVLIILFSANLRPAFGSQIFYHAFHSLPHFALFTASIGFLFREVLQRNQSRLVKFSSFIPLAVISVFLATNQSLYFRENISERDIPFINFAEIFTYGSVIKSLSAPTDTLAVIPHEELLYWYPNLPPATRFLFYEAWVHDVPKFKEEIYRNLKSDPPTFVYWPKYELEPFLNTNDFVSPPRNTATFSALHINKNKLPEISEKQWESISVHGFRKVEQ